MAFELPDLPYAHDALAPHGMSKETLEYHHDLHHKAYVDNGNKLIAGTEWERQEPGRDHRRLPTTPGRRRAERHLQQHQPALEPQPVLGNDGPGRQQGMPGELEKALVESFGSVDEFKSQFSAAGAGQFGSGWAWLVKNAMASLAVTKTENGVNPLCFGQTALLGCDVWEHSYYIDFRNKRRCPPHPPGYFCGQMKGWSPGTKPFGVAFETVRRSPRHGRSPQALPEAVRIEGVRRRRSF